jgi:hypothetical protein
VNVREFSIKELMEIAASKDYSVSYNPFGRFGLRTYIRKAAPWKGIKGDEFWKIAENYKGDKGTLASGLKNAIKISKEHANTYGVSLVRYLDGSYGIMPTKSAKQGLEKTIAEIVASASHYYGLMTKPEAKEIVAAAKLMPTVY